jgi:hypothetical protein
MTVILQISRKLIKTWRGDLFVYRICVKEWEGWKQKGENENCRGICEGITEMPGTW